MEYGNQIFKKKKPNRYLEFDRNIINNQQLSLKAKGMMAILLDQKEGWKFFESELVGRSKDGRISVASALTELEANRYLIRIWVRKKGKYCGRIWVVYDEALTEAEYEVEMLELKNKVKESPNKDNTTDIMFSDIGKTDIVLTDIGKPATNDNNYNENNKNKNNNNPEPLLGCGCDPGEKVKREKEIDKQVESDVVEIFKKYNMEITAAIKRKPDMFSKCNLRDVGKIAKYLDAAYINGKIRNQVGYLMKDPENIIDMILSTQKQKPKSEYEFYVPPEVLAELQAQNL